MRVDINSDETLQSAIGSLRAMYKEHHYVRANFVSGKKRSLDFNAISHVWYNQVSRELGEDTPEDVHCECKLRFGVPIMRAEDEDFKALYDVAIKPLPYEQKLTAMRYIPVTSLMLTEQMKRYCDAMQKAYIGRVDLQYPKDDRAPRKPKTP